MLAWLALIAVEAEAKWMALADLRRCGILEREDMREALLSFGAYLAGHLFSRRSEKYA